MADILKLCYICDGLGTYTCKLCGGVVCHAHYDKKNGVCTECEKGKK